MGLGDPRPCSSSVSIKGFVYRPFWFIHLLYGSNELSSKTSSHSQINIYAHKYIWAYQCV